MRKAIAPILGLMLLLAYSPASADPAAGAEASQWAYADSIRLHGDTGVLLGAMGVRFADPGFGFHNLGFVVRGKCTVNRGKHMTMIACTGRGKGGEIPLEDFSFDPLLNDADLTVKAGGQEHHVHWVGRGPTPYFGAGVAFGGGVGGAAGAGGFRDAKYSGTLFGKPFKAKSFWDEGFLDEEVAVGAYVAGGTRIVRHGNQVTVHRTFRIRR